VTGALAEHLAAAQAAQGPGGYADAAWAWVAERRRWREQNGYRGTPLDWLLPMVAPPRDVWRASGSGGRSPSAG